MPAHRRQPIEATYSSPHCSSYSITTQHAPGEAPLRDLGFCSQWPKLSEPRSVECQWSQSSQKSHSGHSSHTVVSVQQIRMQQQVTLGVRGYSLANKDLFSKSDPYLVVSRPVTRGGWTALRTTETVKNDLNPVWRNIVLYESELPQNGEKLRLTS